ncbi:hypothetical protein D3C71_89770 [compost metagenome]
MEAGRKITPEKAIDILKKVGIQISKDEAKLILDFLYAMANITLDNYLERQSDTDKGRNQ